MVLLLIQFRHPSLSRSTDTPVCSDIPDCQYVQTSDDTGGERVYEQWDCPRVEVTRSYPDQDLNTGDTLNVLRKTKDGDDTNDTSTDNDNIESSKL